jgi:hypothetical protein
MTSTPKWLLKALDERDGHRSAWTGVESDTLVPQHRQGGAGGRRDKHRLSNVVWLESIRNGEIESDPVLAREARRRGIKISLFADPELTPILHAVHGWVLFHDDGRLEPLSPGEIAEWEALQRVEVR